MLDLPRWWSASTRDTPLLSQVPTYVNGGHVTCTLASQPVAGLDTGIIADGVVDADRRAFTPSEGRTGCFPDGSGPTVSFRASFFLGKRLLRD